MKGHWSYHEIFERQAQKLRQLSYSLMKGEKSNKWNGLKGNNPFAFQRCNALMNNNDNLIHILHMLKMNES